MDLLLEASRAEAATWKSALRGALRSVLRSTEELRSLREDHRASASLQEQGNADWIRRAEQYSKRLQIYKRKDEDLRSKLQISERKHEEAQEKLLVARRHHVEAMRKGERELGHRESKVESELFRARVESLRHAKQEMKMDAGKYDTHGKQVVENLTEELQNERHRLRFLEDE